MAVAVNSHRALMTSSLFLWRRGFPFWAVGSGQKAEEIPPVGFRWAWRTTSLPLGNPLHERIFSGTNRKSVRQLLLRIEVSPPIQNKQAQSACCANQPVHEDEHPRVMIGWVQANLWHEFQGSNEADFSLASGYVAFHPNRDGSWAAWARDLARG